MQYYMQSALNILLYYVCGFFIQKSSYTHIFVYATLIDESEKNVYHFSHFFYLNCRLVLNSLVILNNKNSKREFTFQNQPIESIIV